MVGGGLAGKLSRASLVVLSATGLATLVGVFAIEVHLGSAQREALERAIFGTLLTRGAALTSSQAFVFRSLAADNAVMEMQSTVQKTVEGHPDVVFGAFVTTTGRVWAYCSREAPCGPHLTAQELIVHDSTRVLSKLRLEDGLRTATTSGSREFQLDGRPVVEFYEPIAVDGELFGTLRYGLGTTALTRELKATRDAHERLMFGSLVSFAAGLLVVVGIGVLLARRAASRITEPLAKLTTAAEGLTLGGQATVEIHSGDELEVLGTAFNRMVAELEGSYRRLEAKNRELEIEIDERRRAQEERTELRDHLIQAQKMEAFGQLAGGVAHDFNNILAVVIGNSELLGHLLEDEGAPEELRTLVQDILAAADRGANLTRQLLTFSRREQHTSKVVGLNETLRSFAKLIRRVLEENLELVVETDESVAPVHLDPSRLDQVLMNLCVNARDAMPDGGRLTLRTEARIVEEPLLTSTGVLEPGRYSVLVARDTGTGIPKEVLGRIFEPFFTTKAAGRGTGLGLATVHAIVQSAGGAIVVESAPARGTTFSIFLPALTQAETSEFPSEERSTRSGVGYRILVCEDEAPVRTMTKRILERSGYRVLDASTPKMALELLAERNVDLLLTDVIMPTMNGRDLAEAARALIPELPVLFVSGYTAGILNASGVSDESLSFLRKPFRETELLHRVQELIEAHESSRGGGEKT